MAAAVAASLAAGLGHPGQEEQRVDGGLPDQDQERPVCLDHLPVQVDGPAHRHHRRGGARLAALLVHLEAASAAAVNFLSELCRLAC